MNLAWWLAAYWIGMASQAAISAALFPNGIDPDQQLFAAVIFATLALIHTVVGVVLNRRQDHL
jgi:hypothetical protein